MGDTGGTASVRSKIKSRVEEEEESEEEIWDSGEDDETIARIQRAHYAQAAAMNPRRRAPPRPRPMSNKRKLEAVKNFHDFTKKLKKDTGIRIRSLVGNNILELSDFSSEDCESDSDGLSEEEFVVNLNAVRELEEENESYIDPETGDILECKKLQQKPLSSDYATHQMNVEQQNMEPKTLSISDIINEGDIDLSKNVEIAEVETSELCSNKSPGELLNIKQEEASQDFDVTNKVNEMDSKEVQPTDKKINEEVNPAEIEKKSETEDEKKITNVNALNVRRNIREVMDEKNLDASTLAAQRQESERLARVQEQQRIIREVQKQIAINRQNKIHQKTLSLLQGGSSLLKKSVPGQKLNLPNTVLVKLPSGEVKKTTLKQGQVEVTKVPKPTTSGSLFPHKIGKHDQKSEKKEVVEIVDSSSGEETASSSSDSDDCIMLSDSEVPPSPEAEDDPANSGLHVNDAYNTPDEQGRVLINIGHPETEEDIFLAPQIARIIKPHQIGGVRFLFDNIIESVERFSTSTGFGCILAHSMGLGKTLQIVSFCDIFLRHTSSKTVLCIMPINTLQNWVAEFNMWLPLDATNSPLAAHGEVRPRNFPIYVLNDSHKTLQMRAKVVKDWTSTGGVLMIGYELYRLLSMKKDKKPRKKKKVDVKAEAEKEKDKDGQKTDKTDVNDDTQESESTMSKPSEEYRGDKEDGESQNKTDLDAKEKEEKKEDVPTDEDKKLLDEMYEALVRPGPDLVICDEGHRIKNSHSNISYALKQMRTKRRVVLTGYPLQNNLLEYWCMVDFVRPNYLGSKTEFCNMFERPIQNGQCIDSTPQDIRLMRYRAHVLHSLLVGFVQRRSHAVLQSTLPQKEEYVLLVRMTPLQRKLYDRFMNEVVRSTSVPNPLKAFAICCKIWNHPDVLYNFLKKRSEANAAIEEDLDLEEIGGVTKAGRSKAKKTSRKAAKPRGSSKKPAAKILPNTTGSGNARSNSGTYENTQLPPSNGPYGPPGNPGPPGSSNSFGTERPEGYPPYPEYHNSGQGYYPPNQGFNQEYNSNYYQQQPPYSNNYPNQYPQNNPDCNQGYNQNYWNNGNFYGNPEYYNNSQYPNTQQQPEYTGNTPGNFNNTQTYPPNFNTIDGNNQSYPGNQIQQYPNNEENFANQHRPSFQGPLDPNSPGYTAFDSNTPAQNNYPNNQTPQDYSNASFQSAPFPGNSTAYGASVPPTFNQYENQSPNFTGYGNNMPSSQSQNSPMPNQTPIKTEINMDTNYPPTESKPDSNFSQNTAPPFDSSFNYHHQNPSLYSDQSETGANGSYPCHYPTFPTALETKPPLGSAGSPVTSWPIDSIKTDVDKIKNEEKLEMKSESDGEVKIEDLDTKTIVKDGTKRDTSKIVTTPTNQGLELNKKEFAPKEQSKSDISESDHENTKKSKQKGKGKERKKAEKPKPKGRAKAKGRKERKNSKEKNNDDSESEESEKEEKKNKEEELAMLKKAEEMTYDWATELLKDYVPGIIENSAKMELFFYLLNESIKIGDRLLLFSQSLFTLNLIEDYLEKNYIPGTDCLWQRNTSYYRLDGSTHALEREKLINEFNANPNIYLFLVSTRAGSLGINLVGANRVIVFDASWNPCHDTQAVCRVYRYGQQKPCFVYRFVMDWCLEKKIYDRQINKQGMADRVVDECNPDAVLSMKEITNLCFDNDEKESEVKDLSVYKDKYVDLLMQGILTLHGKLLSKEPFQHESLLVDRKEKKLSSAEKRLAQRGYELEKKAALAPKPTGAYRAVRGADGSVVQRPVASVRPTQHAARWIPADVWRRQGMTAQEMTLPLDVVIPTNSAEKTNIVLKAGQRVMVLKSPKGIYMQLESGKIIAIKTSLKGLQKGSESKEGNPIGKKVLGTRPTPSNIPGSLKNNSAITITSKTGLRPGMQRVMSRPSMMGSNKIARPVFPGQKIADIRNRLGEMRSYSAMRAKFPLNQSRMLRPNLPGSVSITKISKDLRRPVNINSHIAKRVEVESDEDAQILDSDEEDDEALPKDIRSQKIKLGDAKGNNVNSYLKKPNMHIEECVHREEHKKEEMEQKKTDTEPVCLTTDEKLPSEEALENKLSEEASIEPVTPNNQTKVVASEAIHSTQIEKKINLLKNYRHQRLGSRPQTESSLSQLERTASTLNKEGIPDFRRNLDDITQSYSPGTDDRPNIKTKKKKSPNKNEPSESQSNDRPSVSSSNMSHSVSSLLSSSSQKPRMSDSVFSNHLQKPRISESMPQNLSQCGPRTKNSLGISHNNSISPNRDFTIGQSLDHTKHQAISSNLGNIGLMSGGSSVTPNIDVRKVSGALGDIPSGSAIPTSSLPGPTYPPSNTTEGSFGQYPGYGMGYGAYPNAPYYAGYGGGYYPPYAAPPTTNPSVPPPENYLPTNQQW